MRRASAYAGLLLLAACAQVRDPQGGPKDVAPPRLLGAEPAPGTTGFTAGRIVLHFDERIRLERPNERIIISPPLSPAPEYRVLGGSDIVVLFRSPLRANTTYSIALGEAVLDLSEGNPAGSLTYVFSTGPALDSLRIHGVVRDAFTDAPGKDALVMLRTDTATDALRDSLPAYIARTDANGRFALEHLAAGRYGIGALRDRNANFRYDLPDEELGFRSAGVRAGDSASVDLRLFREEPAAQTVMEAKVTADRAWRMVLARPGRSLRLRSIDRTGGVLTWASEWSPGNDTVLLWPSDTTLLQDQRFAVYESDSLLDTLTYRTDKRMPFLLNATPRKGRSGENPVLRTSRPVARLLRTTAALATAQGQERIALNVDSTDRRTVHLAGVLPTEGPARLTLEPGTLEDIYGGRNDTLRLDLETLREGATGELRLSLQADTAGAPRGPLLLQLLNAQDERVLQLRVDQLPAKLALGTLPTGTYRLRLVVDTDGNGRWSTGVLGALRQPERVLRMAEAVNVRAGWELDLTWVIGLN